MQLNVIQVSSDCFNVVKEINEDQVGDLFCMIVKEVLSRKEMFREGVFHP
jgi:hypothetical protein